VTYSVINEMLLITTNSFRFERVKSTVRFRRAQQILCSLNPPVAQVLDRSLAVRGGEATQKVVLRYASRGRDEFKI
jgi:hypothetical protein